MNEPRNLGMLLGAISLLLSGCGPVAIGVVLGGMDGDGSATPSPSVLLVPSGIGESRILANRNLMVSFSTIPANATCEYRVDQEPFQSASATGVVEVTVASDGLHELELRQRANPSVTAKIDWTVDTQRPTTVGALVADNSRSHRLQLSWNAADDPAPGTGVSSYVVEYGIGDGGSEIRTTVGTSLELTGLEASRPVTFRVRAIDAAGNSGDPAELQTRTDTGGDGTFAAAVLRGADLAAASDLLRADVDGDRLPDVAVAHMMAGAGALTVLRASGSDGRPDGNFSASTAIAIPANAVLAGGDFDRDHDVDLLAAGAVGAAGQLVVRLGAGNGTFANGDQEALPSPATTLLAVDFDDDAIHDAIVGTLAGNLLVFRGEGSNGRGNGSFVLQSSAAIAGAIRRVAVVDVDDDRNLDLVVASDAGLFVVRGLGNFGLAAPARQLAASIAAPADLVMADVNGDGVPDLCALAGDRRRVQVAYADALDGRASGSFTFSANYPAIGESNPVRAFGVADVDTDKVADIVVVEQTDAQHVDARLLRGNLGVLRGTFIVSNETFAAGASASALLLADIDGRGTVDAVVANPDSGTLSVLRGNGGLGRGDGTFVDGMGYDFIGGVFGITAEDFDGDGIVDLAASVFSQFGAILVARGLGERGVGTGGVGAPQVLDTQGRLVPALLTADLNGDRVPDLVACNQFQGAGTNNFDISTFLGRSEGPFDPGVLIPIGLRPRVVATGVRRNRVDLVVCGDDVAAPPLGGNVRVLRDDRPSASAPNPVFTPMPPVLATAYQSGVGLNIRAVTCGDFNGDAIPDLVVAGFAGPTPTSPSTVRIFFGQGANGVGTANFSSAPSLELEVFNNPETVLTGDFDGDGNLDLLVACNAISFQPGGIHLFYGDGLGSVSASVIVTATPTRCVAAGDFNGDGITDLATGLQDPNIRIRLGTGLPQGQAPFLPGYNVQMPGLGTAFAIAVADVNSDGIPDIVASGQGSVSAGRFGVLLGRGVFPTPIVP